MIGVYAVRNIATNRSYVGSSIDVKRRLVHHKSAIKTGNFLHYQGYADDAKKFGLDAFEFRVLAETDSIEIAQEIEEAFLDLFLDDLYNVTKSAKGGAPEKRESTQAYAVGAQKRLADPEYRTKLSNACKGKRQIVVCPHCLLEGGGGNMRRYHFDKCKVKK
jgi:group I intron endonuclease|uniref:Intron associated endonuclease n=1 Tax=Podoviridae sp. ctwJH20 TaxID=2827753 RepID=A0A8S5TD03_9CAUD|nr:MAG TPA: intron associated endonuclease [Podoviridae sp. ctwJH20]